jgi:sporulation protein YlmC with PRC-barrel domain
VARTARTALVGLEGSGLGLARPGDDVRGLTVVDPHGHRIGEVGDLVIDPTSRHSRALIVTSGGLAGMRKTTRLVPVEIVADVDERVHIRVAHTRVHAAPSDPASTITRAYERVCADYGVRPYGECA